MAFELRPARRARRCPLWSSRRSSPTRPARLVARDRATCSLPRPTRGSPPTELQRTINGSIRELPGSFETSRGGARRDGAERRLSAGRTIITSTLASRYRALTAADLDAVARAGDRSRQAGLGGGRRRLEGAPPARAARPSGRGRRRRALSKASGQEGGRGRTSAAFFVRANAAAWAQTDRDCVFLGQSLSGRHPALASSHTRGTTMSWKMFAALAALILATAGSATPPAAPVSPQQLVAEVNIPHQEFTLPNGLRVIVHEDHKAPVVAVSVWYSIGSKDEPRGPHRLRPSVRASDVRRLRAQQPELSRRCRGSAPPT